MPLIDNSISRSPILSTLVDGAEVQGVLDARVVSTNYYSSDWFEVSFSLDLPQSPSINFWTTVRNPLIEIKGTLRKEDPPTSLILGHADSVSIDTRHRVVMVTGRDLSALMVDTSINRSFPNQSAGEIVTFIAAFHGLIPRVVPTADLVGRLYGGSHIISLDTYQSRSLSDWDIIVRMAMQYGYDAYVDGRSFFFHPTFDKKNGALVIGPGDCTQMRVTRDICLERRRPARLISWNQQMQQEIAEAALSGSDALSEQSLEFFEPNVNHEHLASVITRASRARSAKGLRVQLTMPGETTVSARSQLLLQGVADPIDGKYDIESVERTFNIRTGFTQHVRGVRLDTNAGL